MYRNFSRPSRFRRKFSRSARFQEFQKTFKMFRISIDSRFKLQYFSIDSSCINHFSHWFFITMPLGSYSSMITLWWQLRPIMSFKWKFLSQWNWIYWNLWVLKSEVLLKGSTEICELRSTEISSVLRFVDLLKYEGLNLEGLLKFGVLKFRGQTFLLSIFRKIRSQFLVIRTKLPMQDSEQHNEENQLSRPKKINLLVWKIDNPNVCQRVYWDTKRKPEEPMVYWDLEDLLKSQANLFHLYSQHNFGRAARVWNHFPCISPQKTHFFRGRFAPALHPAYTLRGLSVAHALTYPSHNLCARGRNGSERF